MYKKYVEDNFDTNIELISTNCQTKYLKLIGKGQLFQIKIKIKFFSDPLLYNFIINDKDKILFIKVILKSLKLENGIFEKK